MKNKGRIWSILIVIFMLSMSVACSSNEDTKPASKPAEQVKFEGSIKITGLDKEVSISIEDIYKMEPTEVETESVKSSGEVLKNRIKGVLLQDILKQYGTKEENFTAVQMIAGDGYSVVAPKEIIEKRDILLVYEVDGEPLSKKAQPLMSAVPNERSMYWVKNLAEVELLSEDIIELRNIVILETASAKLEQSDYVYYEDTDKAIKAIDLLSTYTDSLDKKAAIVRAVDGLEKEEDIKVLKTGYLKITGKDTPLFLSPELPKGMHVKEILAMEYKENVFVSLDKSKEVLDEVTMGDVKGLALKDLIKLSKIKTGKVYNLIAQDGYEIEITADMVDKGIISKSEGLYVLSFDGMDKQYTIKGIEKIVCVK